MKYLEIKNKYKDILQCSFECGPGWLSLIDECLSKILPLIKEYEASHIDEECDFPMRVTQIKEKYGTLRIYFSCELDSFDPFIDEAESKSSITCEQCGAPAKLRKGDGWWSTLCKECDKSRL